MSSNNKPQQRSTNRNPFYFNINDGYQYKVPPDFETIRRDHPDEYELQVKCINSQANNYVNYFNSLSIEHKTKLYSIAEDTNRKGCFPPIVLQRIAAYRAMLSSTPTKYSFCPFRRIVRCCCPNTITDHVKYCCPIPVQDIDSLFRDHPTECLRCFCDFLSFFVTYNNCTTNDEQHALMLPYREKAFSSESHHDFFGPLFEEDQNVPSDFIRH